MRHLRSVFHLSVIILALSLCIAVSASAQPPGGEASGNQAGGQMGGSPAQQGGGGQGGMQMAQQDPAQMQQMMAQRYQELLEMSDEEWSVIGPYVLKVATLSSSSQSRSGMRAMMGRGNTGGTRSQGQEQTGTSTQGQRARGGMQSQATDENLTALQTLLEDQNATSDEIKSKLSALRKARETSKKELATAQKQLRELLTLRQEAMLVVMGLLE